MRTQNAHPLPQLSALVTLFWRDLIYPYQYQDNNNGFNNRCNDWVLKAKTKEIVCDKANSNENKKTITYANLLFFIANYFLQSDGLNKAINNFPKFNIPLLQSSKFWVEKNTWHKKKKADNLLIISLLRVENKGVEPLTPCLQSRCSSQLS